MACPRCLEHLHPGKVLDVDEMGKCPHCGEQLDPEPPELQYVTIGRYKAIVGAIDKLLQMLNCDPVTNAHFKDTPRRMAQALIKDFTPETFEWRTFDDDYSGMITLSHHIAWTRCPHHLERVKLDVTVSYVPRKGKVLGVSKLARLVDSLCKGAKMQETLTDEVVEALDEHLEPLGCACHITGQHHCMCARGVETDGRVHTCSLKGIYMHSPQTRDEFLRLAMRK